MGPGGGVGTQPSGPTWVLLGYFGPMVVDGSPVIVLVLPTAFSPPFDENTGTQDNRGILLPASSDAVTSHETLKFHPAVTPPPKLQLPGSCGRALTPCKAPTVTMGSGKGAFQ